MEKIKLVNMKRVVGSRLIHVEYRSAEGHNQSGGEEILMEFDNGGEILIFLDDDNILWVEGD